MITAERQIADAVAKESFPPGASDQEDEVLASRVTAHLEMLWSRTFVEFGAVGWNLLDASGEPRPFDAQVILEDWGFARTVAEAANDLYSESVMAPFLKAWGSKSHNGQTATSTSPRRASKRRSARPSSPVTTAATPPSLDSTGSSSA